MQGKITLITPPDFFENANTSVLFVNLSDKDQEIVSEFLAKSNLLQNLNFYVFNNETNVSWLLYAANRCEYKFVEYDNIDPVSYTLGSYLLTKSNTFYKTEDENLVAILSHINQNKINDIKTFLERIVDDQK